MNDALESLIALSPDGTEKPSVYVEKLTIDGLRGMDATTIEGFAPLTIFVGRNGTRKSTILEALVLAASPTVTDAAAWILQHRTGTVDPARWLFPRGDVTRQAAVGITCGAFARRVSCRWDAMNVAVASLRTNDQTGPFSGLTFQTARTVEGAEIDERESYFGVSLRGEKPTFARTQSQVRTLPFGVQLVRPGAQSSGTLADQFSQLESLGKHKELKRTIAILADRLGIEDATLKIGSEHGRSFLMLSHADDRGVPVALSGDGGRELIENAISYSLAAPGLFLHEEPEVHLHPGAQRELARVMAGAVKRGVQVVITTHSLELIDALLAEMHDALDSVAVFQTSLERGQLRAIRVSGADAESMRSNMNEDLR
jgi:predicted ATPase